LLAWTVVFHSIPVITLIGPWYVAFRQLGLYALIVTHLTINLPMTVWLMMAFLKEVPPELEEAALVDGCRPVQAPPACLFPTSRRSRSFRSQI
jgi:multiple sugar transport system permease protein